MRWHILISWFFSKTVSTNIKFVVKRILYVYARLFLSWSTFLCFLWRVGVWIKVLEHFEWDVHQNRDPFDSTNLNSTDSLQLDKEDNSTILNLTNGSSKWNKKYDESKTQSSMHSIFHIVLEHIDKNGLEKKDDTTGKYSYIIVIPENGIQFAAGLDSHHNSAGKCTFINWQHVWYGCLNINNANMYQCFAFRSAKGYFIKWNGFLKPRNTCKKLEKHWNCNQVQKIIGNCRRKTNNCMTSEYECLNLCISIGKAFSFILNFCCSMEIFTGVVLWWKCKINNENVSSSWINDALIAERYIPFYKPAAYARVVNAQRFKQDSIVFCVVDEEFSTFMK